MNMETKIFYRVANINSEQGLWYSIDSNFTGDIHTKYNFCTNSRLPMPYDENIVGYLSVTDNLEDLYKWFTKDDIIALKPYGFRIVAYLSDDYKFYNNHYLINKDTSKIIKYYN